MGEYVFNIGGKEYKVDVKGITGNLATVVIDGKEVGVTIKQFGKRVDVPPPRVAVKRAEQTIAHTTTTPVLAAKPQQTGSTKSTPVRAPIPGIILKIMIKEGDSVKAGQDILVMEAMKMENQIQATASGVVSKINVKVDDAVQQEDVLIEIDPS